MELKLWISFSLLVVLMTSVRAEVCPAGCTCTDGQKTMICRSLSELPQDVDPQFTEFIFDNCNFPGELTKMPASYSHAHMLQIINSNIESVASGAFEDMSDLTMLSLRGNKIQHFDSSKLIGLSKLVTIDLQGNLITVMEDELFEYSPLMNKVIFSDNPITTIKDRVFAQPEGETSQIEYLELENCNLKTIPTAALCMSSMVPNLVSLDLSHNDFSNLESGLFSHLSGIERLELDSCHMSEIRRDTFAGLTKLKSIRLSNNKLSSIEEESFGECFATLSYVHLDYNQLTVLPYGLFNWGTIKVLNISNNPWECSCSNGWIQEYNILPNDTNYNVTCASPDKYKGKNALHVMKNEIELCEAPGSGPDPMIALYIAIPIIIILSIVTIFIIVKICILKKKDSHGRSAQYSLVYKPTTEKV